MNNYIGVDISINSTAVYIQSNKGINILSFTNKKDSNKYIKELENYGVKFFFIEKDVSKNYSINEVLKLKRYDYIAHTLAKETLKYIDINENSYCQIEGYSFTRNTQSILDVVSLSTLIRCYLMESIKDLQLFIISPKSLKLESCKMCYEPVNIGIKKVKYKYVNNDGVAGGSFKKPDMYKAIIDGHIDTPIYNMLNDYKDDLLNRDKIPNPIEDINDATFACVVLKRDVEKQLLKK